MKRIDLAYLFEDALRTNAKYVAVVVRNKHSISDEVIINPRDNFEDKLNYYMGAYDENLVLNNNKDISIVTAVYGNSFEVIEAVLKQGSVLK